MEPNTPTPLEVDENENRNGNGDGNGSSNGQEQQDQTDQAQETEQRRPALRPDATRTSTASNTMSTPGSNTMSTTASNTINKMTANPSTAYKMANVVTQLDQEGKLQLDELVGEFDKNRHKRREKPKGEIASPDYHEQNPWHDQEKKQPNFSLGDTFPRKENSHDVDDREQVRDCLVPCLRGSLALIIATILVQEGKASLQSRPAFTPYRTEERPFRRLQASAGRR